MTLSACFDLRVVTRTIDTADPTDANTEVGPAASVACWSPSELADLLSISPMTLRNWRSLGKGPHYLKVGGCVRYPVESTLTWLISGDARNVGGTP